MTKVFIDTNIIIDYTKGHSQDLKFFLEQQREEKIHLYVNPVVISEFFTDKNLENKKKHDKAIEFFKLFEILNINKETGLIAGKLVRDKRVNFLADALIAATCLHFNLYLATKDKKDFSKIENLKLY